MFRARKRGREAAVSKIHEVPVDATAEAAVGTPSEKKRRHPVAAFANTVYVDPVVKVRKRPSFNWWMDAHD